MRLSVTARIALLSIGLAFVSNLLLAATVWRRTHAEALALIRRETIDQADELAEAAREGGSNELAAALRDARDALDPSLAISVLDARGRPVAGFGPIRPVGLPLQPTAFRVARVAGASPLADRQAAYELRQIGGRWLFVGRVLDLVDRDERAFGRALLLSLLVSPVLGVAAGLVVTRYVGRRLDGIAATVRRAGQGELARRVELVARRPDAFDRLAAQLNATLARQEQVMGELRVVSDGLAHDLRSPIARLRTKTEAAILANDPAQQETALSGLLAETDLVLRMLSTMMEITRSEATPRDRFGPVDPAALVEELAELYGPVAEDAGLRFTLALDARPGPIAIHRELVTQAITNMLDNAIRHGAGGGEVTLRLRCAGKGVAIQVEDRGTGIAEGDRALALRRFGRLDAARSAPGAGLGLSLIDAVARLHDGRLELADNAPGLVVRLVLPGE